jgi:hypothetical protein
MSMGRNLGTRAHTIMTYWDSENHRCKYTYTYVACFLAWNSEPKPREENFEV